MVAYIRFYSFKFDSSNLNYNVLMLWELFFFISSVAQCEAVLMPDFFIWYDMLASKCKWEKIKLPEVIKG